jgi:hypothetical protein
MPEVVRGTEDKLTSDGTTSRAKKRIRLALNVAGVACLAAAALTLLSFFLVGGGGNLIFSAVLLLSAGAIFLFDRVFVRASAETG